MGEFARVAFSEPVRVIPPSILQNGATKVSVNKDNVEIAGNLIVSGDVKAGNISLKDHTHAGVHGDTSKAK